MVSKEFFEFISSHCGNVVAWLLVLLPFVHLTFIIGRFICYLFQEYKIVSQVIGHDSDTPLWMVAFELSCMQNNEQLPLTDMQKLYKTAAEIWLKDDHPENHIHLRLARMYEYGLGVPEDLSLAIDHYKAALKTPETEYKLGQLMQRIDGDATEIYAHYAAARVGMLYAEEHRPTSATAQQAVRLATMYRYGLGCDADHETAVHWYTVAAERGSIYAQQRLEVMEMQRIRQEQRAAEYAEKQQQQQNLSFAARLLNTIGNALCRQTLRDQQSATATTDRKQRRMQRRLKRALGQKEDYEQIFQ